MTLIAIPIRVERSDAVGSALERARHAADDGADLVEWRVDGLLDAEDPPGALAAAGRLVVDSPRPCIVTCRPHWEGGGYQGPEDVRWTFLESLVDTTPPRFVDLELAAVERARERFERLAASCVANEASTTIVLSVHDFEGRPANLLRGLEAMAREPACGVIKLAWQARSLRDNLETLELLAARSKPMIALCMGRFGLPSRVLAPKGGGLLTFATDEPGHATAAGQPTIRDLRHRYRFDSIGKDTRVYGVIGWPVEHSRGPDLHNAAFTATGHDGVYLPLPVPPEDVHLKATLGAMLAHDGLDFAGASVTLPHKEHVLALARELGGEIDPLCERIGAANTVVVRPDGSPRVLNTDCPAAIAALCEGMGVEPRALRERRVAVLGAGGVARAVAVGLASAGASVVLFNRTPARAETLAEDLCDRLAGDGDAAVVAGTPDALARGGFTIIVNCTSVGMVGGPAPDASPLDLLSDEPVPLDDGVTVLETVYTPAWTPLLRDAAERGARTIDGVEMFIRQAGLQFQAWTGQAAPLEVFREVLAGTNGA